MDLRLSPVAEVVSRKCTKVDGLPGLFNIAAKTSSEFAMDFVNRGGREVFSYETLRTAYPQVNDFFQSQKPNISAKKEVVLFLKELGLNAKATIADFTEAVLMRDSKYVQKNRVQRIKIDKKPLFLVPKRTNIFNNSKMLKDLNAKEYTRFIAHLMKIDPDYAKAYVSLGLKSDLTVASLSRLGAEFAQNFAKGKFKLAYRKAAIEELKAAGLHPNLKLGEFVSKYERSMVEAKYGYPHGNKFYLEKKPHEYNTLSEYAAAMEETLNV